MSMFDDIISILEADLRLHREDWRANMLIDRDSYETGHIKGCIDTLAQVIGTLKAIQNRSVE